MTATCLVSATDEPDDDTQLPIGFSEPFGRAVELVPEDANVRR